MEAFWSKPKIPWAFAGHAPISRSSRGFDPQAYRLNVWMCFQQSVSDLAKAVLQGLRLRFTDTHRRNLDALTAVLLVDVEIKTQLAARGVDNSLSQRIINFP
jgi:hypothetical protein